MSLLLASRCCGQCLTSNNRIVSGRRAAQIIADCRRDGTHFQCHKGSMAGQDLHCRGVHDLMLRLDGGSSAYQFATRLGVPVIELDPETLATPPMLEVTQ